MGRILCWRFVEANCEDAPFWGYPRQGWHSHQLSDSHRHCKAVSQEEERREESEQQERIHILHKCIKETDLRQQARMYEHLGFRLIGMEYIEGQNGKPGYHQRAFILG